MSRSTLPEINRTKALENTRWKIFTARMLEPTNHPCFYRKMIWTPNLLNLQGVLGGAPKGHFRVYFCFGKGNWFSIHIPNQSGVVDNLWPEPNPHFKRDFLHKMQVLHIHVIRFREHSGYEDVLFNDKTFHLWCSISLLMFRKSMARFPLQTKNAPEDLRLDHNHGGLVQICSDHVPF